MQRILLAIVVFLFSLNLNAQQYNTGVGLRGGFSNGITVKHFFSGNKAFEGIISNRWRGLNLTGLVEFTQPFAEGFDWYYGVGGHIGFWRGYNNHPWFDEDENNYTVIGLDGIIGIEYTFKEIPLNLSLDYKPAFNLYGYWGYWGDEFALSLRFIIN